jgi:hypothetical protein
MVFFFCPENALLKISICFRKIIYNCNLLSAGWYFKMDMMKILCSKENDTMELIKDLPSIFEEFSEQRKNAFLRMHELKKQGKPFVGGFCTYLPKELPMAMGACMVGLCSKDGETIPDAEQDLPRNL